MKVGLYITESDKGWQWRWFDFADRVTMGTDINWYASESVARMMAEHWAVAQSYQYEFVTLQGRMIRNKAVT